MKITAIPQLYRNVNRWGEILAVLSKYGLADWLSRFRLDMTKGWLKDRAGAAIARRSRETRIRMALMELGPTFIKLGQILSTRPDLVGVELAAELGLLQGDVDADPPAAVYETIEQELGRPVDELFELFEDTPMASASIGQVHRARLKDGQEVAVKVQHQAIEKKMRVDLDILAGLAQMAERVPEFANYRPQATVAEFQRTLRRELDFGREERNMQQFAKDFANEKSIKIPTALDDYSTSRVLTMELIDGIKLTDRRAMAAAGLDLQEVARRGATLFLEMIFSHGWYHADPHPGNIVLLKGNAIGLLDFGMVGRIDESLREDLERILAAIVSQDAEALSSLIMRIGEVPLNLDEPALRMDLADFVVHFGNQPLDAFDLSGALGEMTEIIRRYHIMLPAQVAMLFKTLIMLEGTASAIYPHFSLMQVMRPFRRNMLRRQLSPARRLRKLRKLAGDLEQLAEVLPRRVMDILTQVESGKFDVHLNHRGLEPSVNRLVLGMLTSALFLGSSLLLAQKVWPVVFGKVSVLGAAGCLVSLFLGLRLLRAINKSGHLDRRE
ncbi:MAG: AarF/ABC1/UbiB kinase family protein [Pirellulales bacterium]